MGEKRCLAGHSGTHGFEDARIHGAAHGYGIARRIEQTSGDQLIVQYGTLYPALLRLEQRGTSSRSGVSPTTIAARFYKLTVPDTGK